MPIYGFYDGETITFDVVGNDESDIFELTISADGRQICGQYTATDLNVGITIQPVKSASIELVTPSGAAYIGEF